MADPRRVVRLVAWLVFGLVLGGFWSLAYAEDYPYVPMWAVASGQYTNQAAGCSAMAALYAGKTVATCAITGTEPNTRLTATFSPSGGYNVGTNHTCPGGGTYSASTNKCMGALACVLPAVRNIETGLCSAPPCPSAGSVVGSATSVIGGAGQTSGLSACLSSCTVTAAGGCNQVKKTDGTWSHFCYGPFTATGASCVGAAAAVPQADPATACVAKGQSYGTVNGVVVCVPAAAVSTSSTKTTTTPSSTTSTTTVRTCVGDGSCSTTTTTTITSGGSGPNGTGDGATTTSDPPTTDDQSKQSLCEENPDLKICKPDDEGTFSGACGVPPACTGDAVQCAQATSAYEMNCNLKTEPDSSAYLLGKAIAGGGADPAGNPLAGDQQTTVDVSSIIANAASRRTLTAACVPAPTFSVLGQSYTMDVVQFCKFAEIIGYMMVAVSSVLAVRSITGGA